MPSLLSSSSVRVGAVRGRYFRENFAQGGTVYAWAAEEILARRLAEERPAEPAEYAAAVRREAQSLRYRAHERLMRAFLDDDVYEGRVQIARVPRA